MTLSETTNVDRPERALEGETPVSKGGEGSYVVALGASAQGLAALKEFFGALPAEPGMAFVVIQHLDPESESDLAGLLRGVTSLEVEFVEGGESLRPNRVYVCPPGKLLEVEGRELHLRPLPELEGGRETIDVFFRSLARSCGHESVGILLSGAGTDGTPGLRAIKEHGGLTMAQEPSEAGVGVMPESAVEAGVADFVDSVGELAGELVSRTAGPRRFVPVAETEGLTDEEAEILDGISALVRTKMGRDLSTHKRSMFLQRVGRRMKVLQIDRLEDYVRYLRTHESEIETLYEELSITSTRYFPNEGDWNELAEQIVPLLFEGRGEGDEIRAWVPGCSAGGEAYTLAMLLTWYAESLDDAPEVKVFATDMDVSAVESAREGNLPNGFSSDIPPELFDRYVSKSGGQIQIDPAVRKRVLFAVHDALDDPPFSSIDLISCRNVLSDLKSDAQKKLLQLFHYSLRPEGILIVGPSDDSAIEASELFEKNPERDAIYRARPDGDANVVVPGEPFGFEQVELEHGKGNSEPSLQFDLEEFHRASILEEYAPPSVLLDEEYRLLHVVGEISPYLSVPSGEPTDDALQMMAEPMRSRARPMFFQALRNDGSALEERVPFESKQGEETVSMQVRRREPEGRNSPVLEVTFREGVREQKRETPVFPRDRGSSRVRDEYVQNLEEELEETRSRLRVTVDRYESTNDRLRASNEELVAMNEELQSTKEELETNKRELEAMNATLTAVNEELNTKVGELDSLNNDLKNLLRSTDIGTVFLDENLAVERYTGPATEYFNLTEADLGRPIDHVTHRLDTERLATDAREVLDELKTIEREISTSDGQQHLLFRALPYLTIRDRVDGVVLTFIDITARRRMQEQLARSEMKFRTVFESAADPMFVYEFDSVERPRAIAEVNGKAVEKTGFRPNELMNRTICDLLGGENFDCEEHLRRLSEDQEDSGEAMLQTAGSRDPISGAYSARRMQLGDTHIVVEVVRDITHRKHYEQALVESRERAEELAELRSMFLSTLSHDVRSPLTGIMAMTHVLKKEFDGEDLDYVRRIERSAERLRDILDSILRMARVETNKAVASPETFDLVEHIREVIELNETRAKREGLTLEYEGPDSPLRVKLDSQFLTQILNNLIENAIKYTEQGGVTVRIARLTEHEVRVAVADTGVGIPEDELEAIFERFETSSLGDRYDSVGLGLAITELLVDSMNGTISVDSEPGEGSCFSVDLPRKIGDQREPPG